MNILLLGDIAGPSGRKAIIEKLPQIIKKKEIDFTIVNGENAGDMGVGITKKNFDNFLKCFDKKCCRFFDKLLTIFEQCFASVFAVARNVAKNVSIIEAAVQTGVRGGVRP